MNNWPLWIPSNLYFILVSSVTVYWSSPLCWVNFLLLLLFIANINSTYFLNLCNRYTSAGSCGKTAKLNQSKWIKTWVSSTFLFWCSVPSVCSEHLLISCKIVYQTWQEEFTTKEKSKLSIITRCYVTYV